MGKWRAYQGVAEVLGFRTPGQNLDDGGNGSHIYQRLSCSLAEIFQRRMFCNLAELVEREEEEEEEEEEEDYSIIQLSPCSFRRVIHYVRSSLAIRVSQLPR